MNHQFSKRSSWNPSKGHPALKIFISQLKEDIFSVLPVETLCCKWEYSQKISTIIKLADKGSCLVLWDRADYLTEAENQLSSNSTYKEVKFGEEELVKVAEQSNRMFKQ